MTPGKNPQAQNGIPLALQIWILLKKDLQVEWQSKDIIAASIVFALLALVVFSFALDLQGQNLLNLTPGILWVTFLFSGILGLGRSFALEKTSGSLEGLLLAPIDPGAIYLSKVCGNLLFMGLTQLAIIPIFSAFFRVSLFRPALILVILPLGTLGMAAIGTLTSAIASHTRAREVLLPILLIPFLTPVLIASVKSTVGVLTGDSWDSIYPWINLLIGFDALILSASYLLFDHVVNE